MNTNSHTEPHPAPTPAGTPAASVPIPPKVDFNGWNEEEANEALCEWLTGRSGYHYSYSSAGCQIFQGFRGDNSFTSSLDSFDRHIVWAMNDNEKRDYRCNLLFLCHEEGGLAFVDADAATRVRAAIGALGLGKGAVNV